MQTFTILGVLEKLIGYTDIVDIGNKVYSYSLLKTENQQFDWDTALKIKKNKKTADSHYFSVYSDAKARETGMKGARCSAHWLQLVFPSLLSRQNWVA